MTALGAARMLKVMKATSLEFSGDNGLADGETAYPGGLACIDTGDGTVKPGQHAAGLVPIGFFADLGPVVADGATATVTIRFPKEKTLVWMANDTGTAVTTADVGQNCYVLDDQTVTGASSGNSVAGTVWRVDATKGVLVELAG